LQTSRGQAAISLASCFTRQALQASGWQCSRRSHLALCVSHSSPDPGQLPTITSCGMRRPSLDIEIVPTPVADATGIERGIEAFSRAPNGGLLLPSDGTTIVHRDLVIALAARHNLPAVYALRFFVTAGGLMSYGTDFGQAFQQAASLVDRILRGAKPIDLPVQTPTKYQTSLNLKTAMALGLTVPPGLLVAADEVIE